MEQRHDPFDAALPADVRAGLVQWIRHELDSERRVSAKITSDRKELRTMSARLQEVAGQLESMASRKVGQSVVMVRTSALEPEVRPAQGQFAFGRFEDNGLSETAKRMRLAADQCAAAAAALPSPQSRPWRSEVSKLFLRLHLSDRGPFSASDLPITLSEDGPLVAEFVGLLREGGYRRSTVSTKRTLEWLLEARQAIEQEFSGITSNPA